MTSDLYRQVEGGLVLSVRLTPKSSRDAVEGIIAAADGNLFLKATVRSIPEDGAANRALVLLMAKWSGLPKSHIEIVSGATSRLKTLRLKGEAGELATCLDRLDALTHPPVE